MRKLFTRTAVLLVAVVAVGCQDLLVENKNAPDRHRALAQPDAVELLVASTFPTFFNRLHRGTAGYVPLTMAADETTNSTNTNGSRDLSEIPRIPFNNNPVTDNHAPAALYWGDMYEVMANATDVLKVINDGLEIIVGEEDHTDRARMFAKLSQGLALGYIALIFDRGYVFDENTPDAHLERPTQFMELRPYQEVMDYALDLLEEAEDLAVNGPDFDIPADWMYAPGPVGRDEVVSLVHAYMARFQVLVPRTPAEREDVDWPRVLSHIDQVTGDVEIELGPGSRNSQYLFYTQRSDSGRRLYAHVRLYGQADTSGAYQDWLDVAPMDRARFLVETPDRRITGETPTDPGTRFIYRENTNVDRAFGGHRESYYQYQGFGGVHDEGILALLGQKELSMYAAEAYFRTGSPQLTANIVNETRVNNGQLPAVTVDGVPEATDCVPRMEDGTCGSLWDALVYERMIELSFHEPVRTWLDRRGLGTLTPGTIIHVPLPAAQLEILGLQVYTWGGVGLPGGAP